MATRHENWGMLWGLLGVSIFAASLPLSRLALEHLSFWDVGVGRGLIASAGAMVFLAVCQQRQPQHWPNKTQIRDLLVCSSGIVFGFPLLTALGMKYAPASHGAVILGILPLCTAIFGVLVDRERPSVGFWLVSLLGLGVLIYFILWRGMTQEDIHPLWLWGDIALLGAAIAASLAYALGGKVSRTMSGPHVICWIMVLSLPLQLGLLLIVADWAAYAAMPAIGWSKLLALGLGCNLLGFFFWYNGLAIGGIARVSQIQYAQPFFSVLIAVILLGERLDFGTILFMLVMVMIIMLSRRMRVL